MTTSGASGPTFMLWNVRAMRRMGLEGDRAWATLRDGALELRGEKGGLLRLPPSEVARVRIGFTEAKTRFYEMKVWHRGSSKPLVITPDRSTWPGYIDIVRAYVASFIQQGRLGDVETGCSKVDALLAPVPFGLLALASVAISIFVLGNEPWWGRMLVPVVPLVLFGLFVRLGITRQWPRPLRDLAGLEPQLPPR